MECCYRSGVMVGDEPDPDRASVAPSPTSPLPLRHVRIHSEGLMIDHGVGVSLQRSYEVKRVDSEYFSEA